MSGAGNGAVGPLPPDFDLESYAYPLEPDRIAQIPAARREDSRLLVVDRAGGPFTETLFRDLPTLLPEGALLVVNDSRVLPARVFGTRATGGRVEFLLLTPPPLLVSEPAGADRFQAEAQGLLRASKPPRPGDLIAFSPELSLEVLSREAFGRSTVRLFWTGELTTLLERLGHMPLPPYIRRNDVLADRERYQTVYSRKEKSGSAAAPTAGLHFTRELRDALLRRGIGWTAVTLYVGQGTFSPVRVPDIRDHRMHAEHVEIGEESVRAVLAARSGGRPVVAVGTTSVRVLEGVHAARGELTPYSGPIDLFIYPGFRFRVTDQLITNFHLPRSSLLMLVSAFAGRERILAAYDHALKADFRVFSYGDAMLIR